MNVMVLLNIIFIVFNFEYVACIIALLCMII